MAFISLVLSFRLFLSFPYVFFYERVTYFPLQVSSVLLHNDGIRLPFLWSFVRTFTLVHTGISAMGEEPNQSIDS